MYPQTAGREQVLLTELHITQACVHRLCFPNTYVILLTKIPELLREHRHSSHGGGFGEISGGTEPLMEAHASKDSRGPCGLKKGSNRLGSIYYSSSVLLQGAKWQLNGL